MFEGRGLGLKHRGEKREFLIDNLLVRIHFIIVMIRWTGLAPREFEFPFPGSLTSTFLSGSQVMMQGYGQPSPAYGMAQPQQQYFPGVQMAPQGRPVHQQQWVCHPPTQGQIDVFLSQLPYRIGWHMWEIDFRFSTGLPPAAVFPRGADGAAGPACPPAAMGERERGRERERERERKREREREGETGTLRNHARGVQMAQQGRPVHQQQWVCHPPPQTHCCWRTHLRLIDSCITQLKAQGPSRTCNASKENKKEDADGPAGPACPPAAMGLPPCPTPPWRQH